MREIKFRSWIKAKKEMLNEFVMDSHNQSETDKNVLMQYTGLKDVNNVEIYEGDILEDFINKQRYEVIWDDYGMFLFHPIGAMDGSIDYYEFEDTASLDATVVIGNIYENSQLIDK